MERSGKTFAWVWMGRVDIGGKKGKFSTTCGHMRALSRPEEWCLTD